MEQNTLLQVLLSGYVPMNRTAPGNNCKIALTKLLSKVTALIMHTRVAAPFHVNVDLLMCQL